jgi:uncharacterized protein YndB with AHSA1/START domain
MKNEPFVIERVYDAPADKVWQALTDREQMKKWYFDIPSFKAEPGFEFQFTGGSEEKPYLHLCKIIEVIPNKKLKHSWRYDGYPGNSFVTWELFDEGKKTKVRLTHEGLETFPADVADLARKNFEAGWNDIVGTLLKGFVEKK